MAPCLLILPQVGHIGGEAIVEKLLGLSRLPNIDVKRWSAPEVLREGRYSTASVVWSLGIVIWECLGACKELPFERAHTDQAIFAAVLGEKLSMPGCLNLETWDSLKHCWSLERLARPEAYRIKQVRALLYLSHKEAFIKCDVF